ncbi:MAG: hypothetical protein RQ739_13070 [Desulfotignum sp.]|nr:hypothetical protein [Desulfotignum sp.]
MAVIIEPKTGHVCKNFTNVRPQLEKKEFQRFCPATHTTLLSMKKTKQGQPYQTSLRRLFFQNSKPGKRHPKPVLMERIKQLLTHSYQLNWICLTRITPI